MFVEHGLEVKADPFSLESLAAWLEKQPADATYNYSDNDCCMLCQFFRANGLPVTSLSAAGYRLSRGGDRFPLPHDFDTIALGTKLGRTNWTFGAALTRAREALASR